MFCSNCGVKLKESSKFCFKCGVEVLSKNDKNSPNKIAENNESIISETTSITSGDQNNIENIIFQRQAYIRLNDNPMSEGNGIITITTNRIHFSASTVLEGQTNEYMQEIGDLSISFMDIANISKFKSLLNSTALTKFNLLLKNNKTWTILIFGKVNEFQHILEQQWKQKINNKTKIKIF